MFVSRTIADHLEDSAWIARMFEEGNRLRAAGNVFDYTIGNPDAEPPSEVVEALRRIAGDGRSSHRYMSNAGFPQVRGRVAQELAAETGLEFEAGDVIMTVGASGACNVILKAILDPGDEVIVLSPYFPDYPHYVTNHGGRVVVVETRADFLPDAGRIAAAIGTRTRAVILNTPNNPTGRVYPARVLREISQVLAAATHPVLAISDEPYKPIVFDGQIQPEVAAYLRDTAICSSWSKRQGLSGERIGYLALSPRLIGRMQLRKACTFANRVLGFINAPALWQLVELKAAAALCDVGLYEERRNFLQKELMRIGYDCARPEGTFYLFPRTPIADDSAFVGLLAREGVLALPGKAFGCAGHMRLSLTLPVETMRKSLAGFEEALRAAARREEPLTSAPAAGERARKDRLIQIRVPDEETTRVRRCAPARKAAAGKIYRPGEYQD